MHFFYLGKVDPATPAFHSGLKSGDKIIEINNSNVHGLNYEEVMQKIKVGLIRNGKCYKDELLLMVIDNTIEEYYNKINITKKKPTQDFKPLNSISDFSNTNESYPRRNENFESNILKNEKINSDHNVIYIDPNQIKYDNETDYLNNDEENEEYQITFI